ncbi:MAG: helix-turn-helix domain-containing protein [Nonomuraea sp.]|nr:helix-turn-helix domain-containing protein [Nonomuraea sp.]
MNAPRLSYEDRRRIAAGLSAGRSYAEIARELGRPRSTISREVSRNGGVSHYRANQAQQATRWRARRRPALPVPEPRPRDPEALDAFEARSAEMMVQTGLSVTASRILAALLLSDSGSATASELAARLKISPAPVSKALRWMVARGMVGREREGRHYRYVVQHDAWYQAWLASIAVMTRWEEFGREGAALLGADTPAGVRMQTAGRFFQLIRQDMIQAAEHYRRTL